MTVRNDASSSAARAAAAAQEAAKKREVEATKKAQAEKIKKMVEYALAHKGSDYVLNSNGESGKTFDCSSLVKRAAASVGIKLPRNSQDQLAELAQMGNTIPVDVALKTPGALLYRSDGGKEGHVAISLGDGTTIEARSRYDNLSNGGPGGVSRHGNAAGRKWTAGALLPGLEAGYGNVPRLALSDIPVATGSSGGGGGGSGSSVGSVGSGGGGAVDGTSATASNSGALQEGYTADQFRLALADALGGMNATDLAALLGVSMAALQAMTPAQLEKAVKAAEQSKENPKGVIPAGQADKIIAAAKAGDVYQAPAGQAPMTMPASFASASPPSPAAVAGVPTISVSALSSSAGIPKAA